MRNGKAPGAHLGQPPRRATLQMNARDCSRDRFSRRGDQAWEAEQAEKARRDISAQARRLRGRRFFGQMTRPSQSAREGRGRGGSKTGACSGSDGPGQPTRGLFAGNPSCPVGPRPVTGRDAQRPWPRTFHTRGGGSKRAKRTRPLFRPPRRRNRAGSRHARAPRRFSADWCDSSSCASTRPPKNSRTGCPGRGRAASDPWECARQRGCRRFQQDSADISRMERSRFAPRAATRLSRTLIGTVSSSAPEGTGCVHRGNTAGSNIEATQSQVNSRPLKSHNWSGTGTSALRKENYPAAKRA